MQDLKSRARAIRLVALDLDGTLLDPAGVLTDFAADVLRRLCARCTVVLTTGRCLDRATEPHAALREAHYIISTNGALVTDRAGNTLLRRTIPGAVASQLAAELLDRQENTSYVNALSGLIIASALPGRTLYGRPAGDLETLLSRMAASGEDAYTVGVQFGDPALFPCYEALAASRYPMLEPFRVDHAGLEFSPRGADKCTALRFLCDRLGISAEAVCALGDNGNDAPMLRYAGLGVAMGNAIAETKAVADVIADDNAHDGAARFLQETFLEK